MAIQTVQWSSGSRLSCARCEATAVVLCIDPEVEKVLPNACLNEAPSTIDATLLSFVKFKNSCGGTFWRYTFSYDDEQLVEGETLSCSDIVGAVCRGCLTTWVEDEIGRSTRDRSLLTQTAHGFTIPTAGVLPLHYDTDASEWVEAQANSEDTLADVVAISIPSVDTVLIQEGGFLVVSEHGLTVGEWYVLDPDNAGGIVPISELSTSDISQKIVLPISDDCLMIRVQAY